MSNKRASVFWNGGSQAIRLPKEFRVEGDSMQIEKHGEVIILRPAEKEWTSDFWACLGTVSPDFERPKVAKQKREKLFL